MRCFLHDGITWWSRDEGLLFSEDLHGLARVLNFACVMGFTAPNSTGLPDVFLFNPRRAATRAEEELSPYLPPNKRAYVFGSLAAQAARFTMWLLPELKVRRACIPCCACCAVPAGCAVVPHGLYALPSANTGGIQPNLPISMQCLLAWPADSARSRTRHLPT